MKISVITPSIRPQFLDITQKTLEAQTFQDFEWHVEIGLRNRGFSLSKDQNKLLRRCTGNIFVPLNDCITIPPDAFERLITLDFDRTVYCFPVGKVKAWGEEPKWDWRKLKEKATGDSSITPNMWEADLAAAPRSMFYDVGGYDEDFDNGWAWDNVEIAWRAQAARYKFKVSTVTEGIALDHDAIIENPWRNKRENNDKRANETRKKAERGDFNVGCIATE